ncbi:MAG: SH3 domain-containing protein [Planctomycetota bacterium]|nr:MAG: SH3 domain-containing protein [Planctomycetota bacterium]
MLLALIALFACATLAPAQPQSSPLLAEAERLYRARDWRGAEAAWEEALTLDLSDAVRARVCRNLGNTAYRLDELPRAVGWFEAARRLAPRDRDAWTNLELARRKLEWPPADRGDLRSGIERVLRSLTAREAEALALLGLLPFALCAAFEALRGGRAAKLCVLAAVFAALACAAPLLHRAFTARDGECLVLAREGAALRAEPSDALAPVGRLDAGSRAWRIDAWPEWVRVEAEDGARGWVPAAQLFELAR